MPQYCIFNIHTQKIPDSPAGEMSLKALLKALHFYKQRRELYIGHLLSYYSYFFSL